jgi:hypothetical protein
MFLFRMAIVFIFLSACHSASKIAATAPGVDNGDLLPSVFKDDRFYLKVKTASGDTALAFCDTGGGSSFTFDEVLRKLKLTGNWPGMKEEGMLMKMIPFRDIIADAKIPAPALHPGMKNNALIAFEKDPEGPLPRQLQPHDMFFGQLFFAGKAWTFDYLNKEIRVNTPIAAADTTKPNIVKIGLKRVNDSLGWGHPSITVVVDDEPIDMLFDTGATIFLSEKGKAAFGGQTNIGGSFISDVLFDKWKARHPDWRIIEGGEGLGTQKTDLIEVPSVIIGGVTTGAVWFAKRRPEVWSKGMIRTMDKVVAGAIGGSALKYLKVTIDYNQRLARIEK